MLMLTSSTTTTTSWPSAESIDLLQQAVEVYTDGGRFSMAAKIQKDIAEMLEAEMVRFTATLLLLFHHHHLTLSSCVRVSCRVCVRVSCGARGVCVRVRVAGL